MDWARITPRGRVHRIVGVVIRWNFLGGTWERPDVTFVLACGPQRHAILASPEPHPLEVCARCDSVTTRARDRATPRIA